MIRRPPRSTQSRSSAASDVYKRQRFASTTFSPTPLSPGGEPFCLTTSILSLIHISEPTRLGMISYAVFCLQKTKRQEEKDNKHTSGQHAPTPTNGKDDH